MVHPTTDGIFDVPNEQRPGSRPSELSTTCHYFNTPRVRLRRKTRGR
jgi:hypothetical protein